MKALASDEPAGATGLDPTALELGGHSAMVSNT